MSPMRGFKRLNKVMKPLPEKATTKIPMRTSIMQLLITLPLVFGPRLGHSAERFAGRFQGDGLSFEAQGNQGTYTGTIKLGENAFQFTATEKGNELLGQFQTQDGQFDF